MATESRPVRARGLKHRNTVEPIENTGVAPRAGAWIETHYPHGFRRYRRSRPVRARGLKQKRYRRYCPFKEVAPRAGAWIETMKMLKMCRIQARRAPCGRVD